MKKVILTVAVALVLGSCGSETGDSQVESAKEAIEEKTEQVEQAVEQTVEEAAEEVKEVVGNEESQESSSQTSEETSEGTAGTSGNQTTAQIGDPSKGEQLFKQYCAACHGQDAKGIQGVGPSLVNNEFIKTKGVEDLVQFIVEGRPANHPDNKTGIPMPPKGGFDVLTEEEITDIVAYIKTLEGNS
ncbi:MAG: cytochrome c [Chlorobi bacterium]|nr:cytochrome c [Chlorobiota bacterium]